jgi:trehalose 6-phosphate phosphatase
MSATPEPTTERGRTALDLLGQSPEESLLALDFDGTLAPIVADPQDAVAHRGAASALAAAAAAGYRIAIITGRPVQDVLRLGAGFSEVPGLVICGHYGMERWVDGELTTPEVHAGIEPARAAVQDLAASAAGATVEDKGHSVALHTRNADDPAGVFDQVRPDAERIAADNDLELVPGRFVLELRPAGVDKGAALSEVVEGSSPRAVLFAGDDLGDLPAVSVLRDLPVSALIVCADSPETPSELRDAADLVVDGPDGVVELLGDLAD